MPYSIPKPVRWAVFIVLASVLFSVGFSSCKGEGSGSHPFTQAPTHLTASHEYCPYCAAISPDVVPYPDHLMSPPVDPYFQDNNGLWLWGHTHNDVVETSTSRNDYVGYKQSNGFYEYSVDDLCLEVGSNGANVYPESCVANDTAEEFEIAADGNIFNDWTEKCIDGGGNNVAVVMTGSGFICPQTNYTEWSTS